MGYSPTLASKSLRETIPPTWHEEGEPKACKMHMTTATRE